MTAELPDDGLMLSDEWCFRTLTFCTCPQMSGPVRISAPPYAFTPQHAAGVWTGMSCLADKKPKCPFCRPCFDPCKASATKKESRMHKVLLHANPEAVV